MLKRSTLAFSLLSLLITSMILISTSVLSYSAFKSSINKKAAYNYLLDLESAIAFATTEAIIKQQTIVICPRHPNTSTTSSKLYCGNNWKFGFIVLTQSHELLRIYNHEANAIITWRAFGQNANQLHNSIQILPSGTTINNGTLSYHPQSDYTKVYKLIINQACKVYITEENASATKF